MREGCVLSLVGDIYAAAERPELWPTFLENLSEALDSKMSVLMHHDAHNSGASVGTAVRLDPSMVRVYEEYYASRNVFFTAAPWALRTGTLLCDTDIDERTLLMSEYYGDFLEPQDARHSTGLVVLNDGGVVSVLSTMRSKKKGPFSEPEFALLRILRPHVQRGFHLHRALSSAEKRATLHAEALDLLHTAVVLLDRNGRITFMNRSAGRIVAEGDGLSVAGGVLLVSMMGGRQRLAALAADAARTATAGTTGSGGFMLVERPSGKRSYSLVVSPLRARSSSGESGGCVAVVITDPEARNVADHSLLRALFGFTPAETRVATRLMAGDRIADVAVALGTSVQTVRSQMKGLFAKSETRRQADLVALLNTVAGGTSASDPPR